MLNSANSDDPRRRRFSLVAPRPCHRRCADEWTPPSNRSGKCRYHLPAAAHRRRRSHFQDRRGPGALRSFRADCADAARIRSPFNSPGRGRRSSSIRPHHGGHRHLRRPLPGAERHHPRHRHAAATTATASRASTASATATRGSSRATATRRWCCRPESVSQIHNFGGIDPRHLARAAGDRRDGRSARGDEASTSSSSSAATARCAARRRSPRNASGAGSRRRSSASRRRSTTTSCISTRASASRRPLPWRSQAVRAAHVEATGAYQWHRPAEADGPRLRLHRLLRRARRRAMWISC